MQLSCCMAYSENLHDNYWILASNPIKPDPNSMKKSNLDDLNR